MNLSLENRALIYMRLYESHFSLHINFLFVICLMFFLWSQTSKNLSAFISCMPLPTQPHSPWTKSKHHGPLDRLATRAKGSMCGRTDINFFLYQPRSAPSSPIPDTNWNQTIPHPAHHVRFGLSHLLTVVCLPLCNMLVNAIVPYWQYFFCWSLT